MRATFAEGGPALTDGVYVGQAGADGVANQGWLLGHFMPKGEVLHSDEVEVKWGVHPPGDRRAAWATGETRTALLVLIRGSFHIELRDRTVLLREPGDYVVWGPGHDHSWRAGERETVVLTVRWPSVPGWRLPAPAHVNNSRSAQTDGVRSAQTDGVRSAQTDGVRSAQTDGVR